MTAEERAEVPPEILAQLRSVCLALPEAHEEQAWVGTRWVVRTRTFAHVLPVEDGWPPAYARAAGADGPIVVLMLRASGGELEALRNSAAPFFAPPWRADEVGMVLEEGVDWDEVFELVTESYCRQAPKALRDRVDRPAG